jgi:hypothetical protein
LTTVVGITVGSVVPTSTRWTNRRNSRKKTGRRRRKKMLPLYCEDCGQCLAVGEGAICIDCIKRAEVELEIDQLRREKEKEE